MRRLPLGLVVGLLLLIGLAAPAGAQDAAGFSLEQALAERVLGQADAPVTIIEYASLTCPHCAQFHKETLPKLKEQFIDTGKAKLVFRDFPLDQAGLAASVLARCAPPERYFGLLEVLMLGMERWATAKDPMGELTRVGKLAGVPEERFKACLASNELIDGILNRRLEGQRQFNVDSTPTFVIDGKKYSGARPIEFFEQTLKPMLGG